MIDYLGTMKGQMNMSQSQSNLPNFNPNLIASTFNQLQRINKKHNRSKLQNPSKKRRSIAPKRNAQVEYSFEEEDEEDEQEEQETEQVNQNLVDMLIQTQVIDV